jgi:hypothetical protein
MELGTKLGGQPGRVELELSPTKDLLRVDRTLFEWPGVTHGQSSGLLLPPSVHLEDASH